MRTVAEIELDYKNACARLGDWCTKKAVAETAMNQVLQEIGKLQHEHEEVLKLKAEVEKAKQPDS